MQRKSIGNFILFARRLVLGFVLLLFWGCQQQPSEKVGPSKKLKEKSILAERPPLGWNSFDSYGVYLHHEAAMANLEAFAEKLKPHGYEYFVIDLGWYAEYEFFPGTKFPNERHAQEINLDEFGLYEPSECYFPKGLQPIFNRAKELDVKIGLHLMRGIPRKAVRLDLPIKGTSHTAAQIADTTSIAEWCPHNYGVDMSKPGAQEWYNSVFKKLADWEVDFVKVDDIIAYPKEIVAVAKAIENSGRPMVYSLSPGQASNTLDHTYYRYANMLRITHDIWDRRKDVQKSFEAWKKYQRTEYPGFWPDLDMIPFGKLKLMSPKVLNSIERDVRLAGFGHTRESMLTEPLKRQFITQRAMAASPLFVGGDLPTMDRYSLQLLTNPDMLACNQNGVMGINTYSKEGIEVYHVRDKESVGKGWIGIFNRNESKPFQGKLTRTDLGLVQQTNGYRVVESPKRIIGHNIWKDIPLEIPPEGIEINLPPDDVFFLSYSEKR